MRICPKCNYVRKETDEAPEWQCPSCQVAYDKVGGQASPTYGRYAPPAPTAAREKPHASWLIVAALIVLAIGIWIGKKSPNRPFGHAAADSAQQKTQGAQPLVVLYAAEWCGYCKATKRFFDANGIVYTELDVEKTTEGREGHKKLGGRGVPLVVIGDDVIHGFDEGEMRSSLAPWLRKS